MDRLLNADANCTTRRAPGSRSRVCARVQASRDRGDLRAALSVVWSVAGGAAAFASSRFDEAVDLTVATLHVAP